MFQVFIPEYSCISYTCTCSTCTDSIHACVMSWGLPAAAVHLVHVIYFRSSFPPFLLYSCTNNKFTSCKFTSWHNFMSRLAFFFSFDYLPSKLNALCFSHYNRIRIPLWMKRERCTKELEVLKLMEPEDNIVIKWKSARYNVEKNF